MRAESVRLPPVALACAADARYAMPLAVMLRSVIATLRPGSELAIYLLDAGLAADDLARVTAICSAPGVSLRLVESDDATVATLPTWGRMPRTTYHRLTIAETLPRELDRVIWLDCDLVVTTDLGALWKTDLAGAHLLAVQDMIVPSVSSRGGIARFRELGLPGDAKYFNAGVMVVDLDNWRADDIGRGALAYLGDNRDRVVYWDQEALNAVLCGRWGEIDPRWNQNASVAGRPFYKALHLDRAAYRALVEDPWIVHFSGGIKPWLLHDVTDGRRALYYRYLDMTPWAGWRPKRTLRSLAIGRYESSRLRTLLYPAEAWGMELVRSRTRSAGPR